MSLAPAEVEDRVRGFIVEELAFTGGADALDDDYPLIDRAVIDSLAIFQVLAFLENEFDVEIVEEDLVPDNFGSISAIARLVRQKRFG